MITIELFGRLRKIFGRFPAPALDIADAAEGVRALCRQIPGFEQELRKGQYRVVRVFGDRKEDTDVDRLYLRLGGALSVQIIPVAAGAKSSFFQIIVGAVLVGAAFLFTGGTLAATAFSVAGFSVTGSQIALIGGLLALSGVSAMLAPEIAQPSEPDKEKQSFMISTPSNLYEQGHCVPWGFGKDWFGGSVIVSNGIAVEDFD